MTWELLWRVVLVGSLAAFAAMSVLVTIFGAMDIRRLLRQLEASDAKANEPDIEP